MTTISSKYVKIPFRVQFREPILQGIKTYTSRPQAMGSPGQMFVAFGARFCLTEVEPIKLSRVCEEFYEQEGFDSPEAFVETWESIHPFKGYTPSQTVYLHKFFKVPPSYPKRERESLIKAFGREAVEAADKVIVEPTGPPKKRRSRKKKDA